MGALEPGSVLPAFGGRALDGGGFSPFRSANVPGYRAVLIIVTPAELQACKSEGLQGAHNRTNGVRTPDPEQPLRPRGF